MEPDASYCLASFERYFYNITSNKCQKFIFGGCGGNANNFETIDECNKACIPRLVPRLSVNIP